VGIVCTLFSHPQLFFPVGNIFGVILIAIGSIFHGLSHIEHEKAHEKAEKIEKLVTAGIYSKIRHPGYLGLILINFGIAFAWGFVSLVVLVTFYAYLSVETAKKEEFLTKKFGSEYKEYAKKVPWRFIPRVI
jgi:protein-S-isoprenylcysteine O-methyltransferase Ste14